MTLRLLAVLGLVVGPAVALAYVAVHEGATGAENGVLWLIGLGALFGVLCVVEASLEARFGSEQ